MSKKSKATRSISFMGALFLLFLGLKLTGYIDWSWGYVTMPLWGGVALFLAIALIVVVVVVIVKILDKS